MRLGRYLTQVFFVRKHCSLGQLVFLACLLLCGAPFCAADDADSTLLSGIVIEPATISSIAVGAGFVIDFKITDLGTSDGLPTLVTDIAVSLGGDVDGNDGVWTLSGPDVGSPVAVVSGSVGNQTLTFSGLSISVVDGGNETYLLYVDFAASPSNTSDNAEIVVSIGDSGITTAASGSTSLASGQSSVSNLGVSGAWFGASWLYRAPITLASAQVANTDQTNFPVMISTTRADWKDLGNGGKVSQSDGGDFVFTASDGTTQLDHEVELYDPATGELVAWVRVPSLSASTDTSIYAYYGGPTGSDYWNASGVWDSNYRLVAHLNETSGTTVSDSTSNATNGTKTSATEPNPSSSGQIDTAQSFDGSNDAITLGNPAALQITGDQTIEMWVRLSSLGTRRNPYAKAYGGEGTITIETDGRVNYFYGTAGGNASPYQGFTMTNNLGINEWTHLALVRDLTNSRLYWYKNGQLVNQATSSYGAAATSSLTAYLGDGYVSNYAGIMDEARVSSTARSADWVLTQYNNMSDPSSFLSVGSEEQDGADFSVVATELRFVTTPVSPEAAATSFEAVVEYTDANGNRDADVSDTLTVTLPGSGGASQPAGGSLAAVSGLVSYSGASEIVLDTPAVTGGTLTFTDDAGGSVNLSGSPLTLTPFTLKDNDADSTLSAGALVEPTTLSSVAVGTVQLFDWVFSDLGSGDGFPTTITQLVLDVAGSADANDGTWTLDGPDATSVAGVVAGSVGSQTITFSGLSISVADGGSETYVLSFDVDANPATTVDGNVFVFTLTAANITHGTAGTSTTVASGQSISSAGTGWFDYSWAFRRTVTISSSMVANTDQSDFPVLISATHNDWRDTSNGGNVGQSDGGDFLFTDSTGSTQLDHEIEYYDSTTGELVAWVRIPTLSASADTVVYAYYGNASASDQWNVSAVWDSNYKVVQHLSESPANGVAGHLDSTSNGNDCTPTNFGGSAGTTTDVAGQVGRADHMDGANDRLTIPDASSLGISGDAITIEAWVYSDVGTGNRIIVNKENVWEVGINSGNFQAAIATDAAGGWAWGGTTAVAAGVWKHLVFIHDNTSWRFYIDGALVQTMTPAGNQTGNIDTSTQVLGLGARVSGSYLDGIIDEVRVSDIVRSADWITTQYNNQKTPATYLTLGAEDAASMIAYDVVATALIFSTMPVTPQATGEGFDGVVMYVDANGNTDLSVGDTLTVTLPTSGGATQPASGALAAINGVVSFTSTDQMIFAAPAVASGTLTFTDDVAGSVNLSPSPLTLSPFSLYDSDTDSQILEGALSEPISLSSVAVGSTQVFDFILSDLGTTDGYPTSVMQVVVNVTSAGTADANDGTWTLDGPDVTGATATVAGSAGSQTLTFSGLNIDIADGASETYVLSLDLLATPTATCDNDIFYFSVGQDDLALDASSATSFFASGQASVNNGSGDWYGSGWLYRRTLTVDATKVINTDQADFPVLINTTLADWRDTGNGGQVGQSDGGDFVFTASDGLTKYDHQIEHYDETTGELVAWVRVPSLSATNNTTLLVYYGNASVADQWNDTGVWDSGFKLVQHLDEGSVTTVEDSTSNATDGTKTSATEPANSTSGQIDDAQSFDGSNDAITLGNPASLQITGDQTIEMWVNISSFSARRNPYAKAYGGEGTITIETNGRVNYFWGTAGGNASPYQAFAMTSALTTGTWTHLVLVRDITNSRLYWYKNGVQVNTATASYGAAVVSSLSAFVGDGYVSNFAGLMDEVRVSNVARSADWVATQYNNHTNPATFYTVGSEQDIKYGLEFDVTATQLSFTTTPGLLQFPGVGFDAVLAYVDAGGNVDKDVTDTLTVSLAGSGGATQPSSGALAAVAGVVDYTGGNQIIITFPEVSAGTLTFTDDAGGVVNLSGSPATLSPFNLVSTNTWVGVNTNWHDGTNWSAGSTPVFGQSAIISSGTNPSITNADAACGSLQINTGMTVSLGATRTLSASDDITIDGTINLTSNSVLTLSDGVLVTVASGGAFEVRGSDSSAANTAGEINTPTSGSDSWSMTVDNGGTLSARGARFLDGVIDATSTSPTKMHFADVHFEAMPSSSGDRFIDISGVSSGELSFNKLFFTRGNAVSAMLARSIKTNASTKPSLVMGYAGDLSGETFDDDLSNRLQWMNSSVPFKIDNGSVSYPESLDEALESLGAGTLKIWASYTDSNSDVLTSGATFLPTLTLPDFSGVLEIDGFTFKTSTSSAILIDTSAVVSGGTVKLYNCMLSDPNDFSANGRTLINETGVISAEFCTIDTNNATTAGFSGTTTNCHFARPTTSAYYINSAMGNFHLTKTGHDNVFNGTGTLSVGHERDIDGFLRPDATSSDSGADYYGSDDTAASLIGLSDVTGGAAFNVSAVTVEGAPIINVLGNAYYVSSYDGLNCYLSAISRVDASVLYSVSWVGYRSSSPSFIQTSDASTKFWVYVPYDSDGDGSYDTIRRVLHTKDTGFSSSSNVGDASGNLADSTNTNTDITATSGWSGHLYLHSTFITGALESLFSLTTGTGGGEAHVFYVKSLSTDGNFYAEDTFVNAGRAAASFTSGTVNIGSYAGMILTGPPGSGELLLTRVADATSSASLLRIDQTTDGDISGKILNSLAGPALGKSFSAAPGLISNYGSKLVSAYADSDVVTMYLSSTLSAIDLDLGLGAAGEYGAPAAIPPRQDFWARTTLIPMYNSSTGAGAVAAVEYAYDQDSDALYELLDGSYSDARLYYTGDGQANSFNNAIAPVAGQPTALLYSRSTETAWCATSAGLLYAWEVAERVIDEDTNAKGALRANYPLSVPGGMIVQLGFQQVTDAAMISNLGLTGASVFVVGCYTDSGQLILVRQPS